MADTDSTFISAALSSCKKRETVALQKSEKLKKKSLIENHAQNQGNHSKAIANHFKRSKIIAKEGIVLLCKARRGQLEI